MDQHRKIDYQSKKDQRGVVIISGATATGKSALALELAKKISGEIVNADIGSFYTPLTIGTAKPDWRADSMQQEEGLPTVEIRHHLFDILDQPENFTVVQFRQRLQILFQEIWDRGHIPIVVGGSAFYIKSFFYMQQDIPGTDIWIEQLESSLLDSAVLWNELQELDPLRAAQINIRDRYRVIRALAIFKATGKKPSLFVQKMESLAPFYFIVCTRQRGELYQKINERVLTMMQSGWQEEVESLRNSPWEDFLKKKKLIGYNDLLALGAQQGNTKTSYQDEVTTQIQQKTRNYAKRQIIFLNKLERELKEAIDSGDLVGKVDEICLTLCDVGLYINGLSEQILKRFG